MGTWEGMLWSLDLSPVRSTITIGNHQWEIVPELSGSPLGGVRWYVRGSDGKRGRYVILLPDGRMGTCSEVMTGPGSVRYKSQRLWNEDGHHARQRQKVLSRLGYDTNLNWIECHPRYTPKKPRLMRKTTYYRLVRKLEKHR
jgi:hypothetical protein